MAAKTGNVGFVRKEVKEMLPLYDTVSDCVDGDWKVKQKKEKYLPRPNAEDVTEANLKRYQAYLTRAIFYNVTRSTFQGLLGQIFTREPQIEVPIELEPLVKNTNGEGLDLTQFSKVISGGVLKHSRVGILADYPKTKSGLSKAEIEAGSIQPVLKSYKSSDIINWRTETKGSEQILTLVVLKETYIDTDDGFEFTEATQYRALRLIDGKYNQELYKGERGLFELVDTFIPVDVAGNPFDKIPFTFACASDNTPIPEVPVLYDIAILNLGHYRNSADYEESCYLVGQPTPYFSGLTEEWVKSVLNGRIQLGSRAAVPLPAGGDAGLLQAEPNTMPKEAMDHKEAQFLAIGAKLVTNESAKTATEARMNNTTETSILANVANNVSEAIVGALKFAEKFVSRTESEIIFKLNTDFEISKMSVEERNQLLQEWMKGGMSFTEYRDNLRKGKIALGEDDEAKTEIDEDTQASLEMQGDQFGNGNQDMKLDKSNVQ